MKYIKGVFHVYNTDYKKFYESLSKDINKLQNDKQEVEIQYKTNNYDNGQLVFSALLIGRVESEELLND